MNDCRTVELPQMCQGPSFGRFVVKSIGASGFEPLTSWSQARRANQTALCPVKNLPAAIVSFLCHPWKPLCRPFVVLSSYHTPSVRAAGRIHHVIDGCPLNHKTRDSDE